MFKDNKLRLLLTLVGFIRLGANDDPDATWSIPSTLTSIDLQEAIDLIRRYEFAPPTYEDGKGPEDMLRSKAAAARKPARRVDWDDDDDGIDHDSGEDRGEYALDGPTARKADGTGKNVLKRRRRARTPVELDDEEKQERANARRQKEIDKQINVKSTMYVHDSDDEDDPEAWAAFFAGEEALRAQNKVKNAKSHILGSIEPASSKKRKADGAQAEGTKKRKTPPRRKAGPFDSDESDEEAGGRDDDSSRAPSEERRPDLDDSEDEATDTPLSSQLAGAIDAPTNTTAPSRSKDNDVIMVDGDDEDDDEVAVRRPAARNIRAGFVIDSDSE
ncbi:Topoisomerase 1-associated factor 1 [Kalmusia sp. IMI 367209]|nr:Topoisomerase 1-associated factor 1 [Kalmusia sp. IMI 367209]